METKIHFKHHDVDSALARLGLTQEPLGEAIKAGYLAWSSTTANDAPFYPALSQWNRTVRELREGLLPLGWSKSDEGNYSLTIDPTGEIALAVASGCPNTGKADALPTTKCPKGPSTVDAVLANAAQLELFPKVVLPPSEDDRITWLLLFHRDEKEIRAELSLPASIDNDGKIDGWQERIILPPVPLDPIVTSTTPDFGPDVDIEVRRRASPV